MKSLIAAIGAIALLTLGSAPASAHAELDSSTPTAPGPLASCPASLRLHFTEGVAVGGLSVSAGPRELEVASTNPDRTEWTATTSGACSAGSLDLSWKSASADDGHTATGQLHFRIGNAAGAATDSVKASTSPSATALAALGFGTGAFILVCLVGLRGRRVG